MLRTVHLHGRLGQKFGRVHKLAVGTVNEAVRALSYQIPGFRDYLSHRKYVVSVGEGVVFGEDQLPMRLGKQRDIHITPAGAVSGIETILLGATLLFAAAASIMVLTMPKAPLPGQREEATKTASFMYDGAINSSEQGNVIQLVYGRMRVGSIVGSAGITTTDVNQLSVSTSPDGTNYGVNYSGHVGTSPGIKDSPAGDEWVLSKGGKAGGGTARAAQEDPNTLQSQATARVLDIIGEGEIGGLVDGLKSVYFDETPLQNADGSFNFAGVTVEQRVGLPDQDFMPGFSQTENATNIDTEVTVTAGPVTRTVSDEDASVARVTMRLPQLYQQDTSNGDLKASSVSVKISVQADGGGFTDVTTMDFVGKTNSGYQRSVDIRLPAGANRDIKVTRLTPDSAVASLSNETYFDILTEVVEAKLSYPDTALIGLTVDARQFGSNIPTRSYDIYGLIIEVPTNYDPIARTYTGVWDGTFKRAWSDNPAWVLRDLIVARRYGLGARIPAEAVDIWGLYAIAQYCDGMVPDGFGGMEPRFTINCCIRTEMAAYDLLASIASNFRGMIYWGSGTIVAAQDRPEDPSVLINPTNVADGMISYGRVTPVERRRSAAVVYWNDPEDGYRLTPEIYEDPDLVRRFGRRTGDEVTGFGITRRGQAYRACKWLLEDEAPSSNATASYGAIDDHLFVEPGRIATIADPMFTQTRRGGRVKSATFNTVTLDAPFTFDPDQNYILRVMLPNGTVAKRFLEMMNGTTATIPLIDPELSPVPNPGAVWTLESNQAVNRQFRVRRMSIDEPPYAVQATLHDPTKYARVEFDADISTPDYIDLPNGPLAPPGALSVREYLLEDGNASIPCVQVSWGAANDPRVTYYQAQHKAPGGNWEPFADGVNLSREVRGIVPGEWGFRARSLDSMGRKTQWVELFEELGGQIETLPEVTGLAVNRDDDALTSTLVWTMPVDHRPLRAEVLYAADGDFEDAYSLGYVDTQEYTVAQAGTYWVRTRFIRAVSLAPPFVEVGLADLPGPTVNDAIEEAEEQIAIAMSQLAIAQSDLAAAQEDLAEAVGDIDDVKADIIAAEGQIDQLTTRISASASNLLKNSSFGNGLANWTVGYGTWELFSNAYGPFARCITPGFAQLYSNIVPVTVGEPWTASADMAFLADDGNFELVIAWYTASDVGNGTSVASQKTRGQSFTVDFNGRVKSTGVAPVGTAHARVIIQGTSSEGSIARAVRQVKFERAAQASPYTEEASVEQNYLAITNQAGSLASLTSTVSTLGSTVSTNSTAITTLNGNYATLSSLVSTQGASITTNATAISNLTGNFATLTTTVGASTGARNRNANFTDWPSGSYPALWSDWVGTAPTKVTGPIGSYAARFVAAANTATGMLVAHTPYGYDAALENLPSNGWWVMEGDVTLDAGTLVGSGLYLVLLNAALAATFTSSLEFSIEPDSTGVAPGAGVVGKRYSFSKLLQDTGSGTTNARLYAMANWAGFINTTQPAKTITFNRVAIRPARQDEIDLNKPSTGVKALVTTNASAITTLNGQFSTLSSTVSTQGSSITTNANAITTLNGNVATLTSTVSTQGASISTQATAISGLQAITTIADTRSVNSPPSYYWANYVQKAVKEFKDSGALGITGLSAYGTLTTTVPWADSSGGPIQQVFVYADESYAYSRYSTGTSTWSAWVAYIGTLNSNVGTLQGQYSSLSSTVSTQGSSITTNATAISTLNSNYSSLSSTVSAQGSSISTNATAISTINGQLAARYGIVVEAGTGIARMTAMASGGTSSWKFESDQFTITKPGGGARWEYSDGNVRIYDSAGQIRSREGVW